MEARSVRETPERYFAVAMSMKHRGQSLRMIVAALLNDGAKPLDLVRVTARVESVGPRTAKDLVDATGLLPPDPGLVIIVSPDDPWHEMIYGSSGETPGTARDEA
jgi:hypothetical protein